MRELYVYYRIRPGAAEPAHRAVVDMQRQLMGMHVRVDARVLRRTDTTTQADTWMEVYAERRPTGDAVASPIDDDLEAEIASRSAALFPFIDGERHVERFDTFGPP